MFVTPQNKPPAEHRHETFMGFLRVRLRLFHTLCTGINAFTFRTPRNEYGSGLCRSTALLRLIQEDVPVPPPSLLPLRVLHAGHVGTPERPGV